MKICKCESFRFLVSVKKIKKGNSDYVIKIDDKRAYVVNYCPCCGGSVKI